MKIVRGVRLNKWNMEEINTFDCPWCYKANVTKAKRGSRYTCARNCGYTAVLTDDEVERIVVMQNPVVGS